MIIEKITFFLYSFADFASHITCWGAYYQLETPERLKKICSLKNKSKIKL